MGEKIQEKVSLKKTMKKLAQEHPEMAIYAGTVAIAALRVLPAVYNNLNIKIS